jgi:hypothetical protein
MTERDFDPRESAQPVQQRPQRRNHGAREIPARHMRKYEHMRNARLARMRAAEERQTPSGKFKKKLKSK